jgi:hypothetical protein
MPGRWTEDRDRQWRERNWRSEAYGRGEADRERGGRSGETRSFGEGAEGARWEGRDRDRVFGEDDTGGGYNTRERPQQSGGRGERGPDSERSYGRDDTRGGYRGGGYRSYGADDRDQDFGRPPAWQDRDYGGVSPAMRQGEYELDRERGRAGAPRFQSQDYTGGGRYYGDDARDRIYRQEYGQGGVEYGQVPGGYDANARTQRRNPDWDERRYARELRRPASGGTGGYDYERGYGDGGRGQERDDVYRGRDDQRGRDEFRDRDDQYERDRPGPADDFLRRAGERLSSWFSGAREEVRDRADRRRDEDWDEGPRRYAADFGREPRWDVSGHRGRGPKNYKRSDDRISDEVHQALTDDPWLDASQITVTVSAGEVTLAGTVENREARRRAERLVEDISGVSHVQNDLRMAQTGSLTSPGRGFGDSVLEAQMKRDGEGDTSASTDDTASTRSTTRRT